MIKVKMKDKILFLLALNANRNLCLSQK